MEFGFAFGLLSWGHLIFNNIIGLTALIPMMAEKAQHMKKKHMQIIKKKTPANYVHQFHNT